MARTGRPTIPRLAESEQQTQAERLVELLTSAPKSRQRQLVDSLWDGACGLRLWVEGGKKPGAKRIGDRVAAGRLTLEDGTEYEGFIYTVPPDPHAAKLLLDHGVGRPGQ